MGGVESASYGMVNCIDRRSIRIYILLCIVFGLQHNYLC